MKHALSIILLSALFAGCTDSDYSKADVAQASNGTVESNGVETSNNPSGSNSESNEIESTSNGGSTPQSNEVMASNGQARVPLNHRASAVMCDSFRDSTPVSEQGQDQSECMEHEDCLDGDNGRCLGNNFAFYSCTYDTCFTDDDCNGNVCHCGDAQGYSSNKCLYNTGNCLVDADCGPQGYCSPSFGQCGAYDGVIDFFCHTEEDTCLDDTDCGPTGGEPWGSYCAYNMSVGRWMCSSLQCAG